MVNKKPPQPTKKSPVIAEPALANRPKRNISPKSWDNSSVLSWREEQELKKALYASLQEVKRQSSDPGEQSSEVKEIKTTSLKETRKSREATPQYQKTRSVSTERSTQKPQGVEIRRHSSGSIPAATNKKNGNSMSEERELRSRTRLTVPGISRPIKLEPQLNSLTDDTSKDSVNSSTSNSTSQENKRKYRAQRKFAQMHGYGYGYCYTPTSTPVKHNAGGGTIYRTPPIKVFPKRAKTEDFLTFLCLRGTHALPPHLDMYNFSREDSNGTDSSYPATPSNGRRPGSSARESSPSSSSTSVSQDDGFCPITPMKNFMTPIKKAARASAGTPEIARGLAIRTRHTKNSQRTAFGKSLDVTPVKGAQSSPGKRKSPSKLSPKDSPAKMAKSDRIRMKKKAVATLATLEKRSRKKSLFSDEPGESLHPKKRTPKDRLITKKIRSRLKRTATNVKKRKKSDDFIASRLPPRKARHSDLCLYVETEDLDESPDSKSPTPIFEPERRKRKMENIIDVDDEISLKVPIKQSRLFKKEMKSRKPKLKENVRRQNKTSKCESKGKRANKNNESPRISTRASLRQQPDLNLSSANMFVTQKLKKLKKSKCEKIERKKKTLSEIIARKKERKEKQLKMNDSSLDLHKVENLQCNKNPETETMQHNPVVRKKGRSPGKKSTEAKTEPVKTTKLEPFPSSSDIASIIDVPTYSPTEEEFSDPIKYLRTVSSMAGAYGMCKIVPPENWKVEGKINEDIRFVTQRQVVNKLYQRFGQSSHKMECIQHYLESHGVIEQVPLIGGIELDLGKLIKVIKDMGGMENVVEKKKWHKVADIMGIPKCIPERGSKLYEAYCKFLVTFDAMSDGDRQQLEEKVKEVMMKKTKEDHCCVKGKNMTLTAFNKISRNIAAAYLSDENLSAEKIEKQYWDILEDKDKHIVVHCGSVDTHRYHCSGFSAKKDSKNPWNLNKLHQKPGSVLQYLGPLQGVTIPVLRIGMLYSTSCWSTSTQLLPFVQYLHSSSDVLWYAVPKQENSKFHSAVKSFLNEDGVLKPNSLMISPTELTKKGVSVSRCVQKPREFVVIFPQCYSANVCCGNMIAESVCYALPDWLSAGLASSQKLDGTEKEPFSMEELLCKIIEDHHASKELLANALPVFQQIVDKELLLRIQLQDTGLKMSRRMCTNLGQIKTSPGGTSRCMDDVEEIVTFCETSKKVCYLSMVLNEADDLAFRPEHGLNHIQKKKNIKSCIFMYRHTNDELRQMIFNATERLKNKDSPESASKRKRKSV